MKKLRLTGVAGLAVAAALVPAAAAEAKQTKIACPKSFEAVPTQALPGTLADLNGNFLVCAKGPQGNGHFNVKDDRTGQNVLPFQWNLVSVSSQDPTKDVWVAINNLDSAPNYFLDPAPDQFVDDVELP
jgi:hypothetical protein